VWVGGVAGRRWGGSAVLSVGCVFASGAWWVGVMGVVGGAGCGLYLAGCGAGAARGMWGLGGGFIVHVLPKPNMAGGPPSENKKNKFFFFFSPLFFPRGPINSNSLLPIEPIGLFLQVSDFGFSSR